MYSSITLSFLLSLILCLDLLYTYPIFLPLTIPSPLPHTFYLPLCLILSLISFYTSSFPSTFSLILDIHLFPSILFPPPRPHSFLNSSLILSSTSYSYSPHFVLLPLQILYLSLKLFFISPSPSFSLHFQFVLPETFLSVLHLTLKYYLSVITSHQTFHLPRLHIFSQPLPHTFPLLPSHIFQPSSIT